MPTEATGHQEITLSRIEEQFDDIVSCNIPVFRKSSTGALFIVPIEELEAFLSGEKQSGEQPFFVSDSWQKDIVKYKEEEAGEKALTYDKQVANKTEKMAQMSNDERAEQLSKKESVINHMARRKQELTEEGAGVVLDASTDMNVVSNLAMTETMEKIEQSGMSEEEAKEEGVAIVKQTRGLVNSIMRVVKQQSSATLKVFNSMKGFAEKSTFSHSNRVFLDFMEFLAYYNSVIDSGYVNKLRIKFKAIYKPYYRAMFKYETVHALEDAFERGMARVDEPDFINYCIAALIHDVGKIIDPEYFEKDGRSDFERTKKHVFAGYKLVTKASRYPQQVALIVGLHHEYNGHPGGYGLRRALFGNVEQKELDRRARYAMSGSFETVLAAKAIGYFPAKLLEIVDIYDTINDIIEKKHPGAKVSRYHILKAMRQQFVEGFAKLDAVLFDLFVDYLDSKDEENLSILRIGKVI